MLLLLLLALLIYTNVSLAKKKGKNPVVWGIVTFFAFFVSYCVMGAIYMAIIYKGPWNNDAITVYLRNEPLAVAMLSMLGVGGVLLVRYVLERGKGSDVA
jgi:hypothetical protein